VWLSQTIWRRNLHAARRRPTSSNLNGRARIGRASLTGRGCGTCSGAQARSLNRGFRLTTSTRTPTRTLRFSAARTMRGPFESQGDSPAASEGKARADLLRETQQHLYRSQYDCEAADRASKYLKAALTSGASPCGRSVLPGGQLQGRHAPQCKDIKNVVTPRRCTCSQPSRRIVIRDPSRCESAPAGRR